jgi:ElaB/YqjD/DUF883 family membrane-anchored ribosome-binding protein
LLEHPELRDFQEKIEKELDKSGTNCHNRIATLKAMIVSKVKELSDACKEIQSLSPRQ